MLDPLSLLVTAGIQAYKYGRGMSTKPVTVNNRSAARAYVAICYSIDQQQTGWATIGWFSIGPHSSEVYTVPSVRFGSKVYLYARTSSGGYTWKGSSNILMGVAEPKSGAIKEGHRFLSYEPKGSQAVLQETTKKAAIRMVPGYEINLGIQGGTWSMGS